MKQISQDIRGAVTGFIILLCKGLLDDDRWDWDVECSDWKRYEECFNDPSILRTTICVFLNNLRVDESSSIVNYMDSRYRAFQYFRSFVDADYNLEEELKPWEYEEPDWYEWEG